MINPFDCPQHDDSVACDRRNKDYSNYASMHYFDIYPLSREIKEQLYRCANVKMIEIDAFYYR